MLNIKRTKSEVSCELCGKKFMQTRWWQVFCSNVCKQKSSSTAKQEVRTLREENKRLLKEVENLKQEVLELRSNAGTHSKAPNTSFKYDDDNQEYWR